MAANLKTTILSLLLLSNLDGLPDSGSGGLTCLRGGSGGASCSGSSCPPCWKKVSATEYHCFEYGPGNKCQFDWTDTKQTPIDASQGQGNSTPISTPTSSKTKPESTSLEKSKSKGGATQSVEIDNPSEPTEIGEISNPKSSTGKTGSLAGSSTITIVQTVKRPSSKSSDGNGADESTANKIVPLSVISLTALFVLQFTF